jgi:hypothetical protein
MTELSVIIQRKEQLKHARFEVPALLTVKFTVFCDVTPCSVVDRYQIFGVNPEDGDIALLKINQIARCKQFTVYQLIGRMIAK